jgi:hypothetical protein
MKRMHVTNAGRWSGLVPLLAVCAAACDTTAPVIENPPLAFSASAEIRTDTVFFQLTAANVTDSGVDLTWGACLPEMGVLLSVHDAAGGPNSLRWDETVWPAESGCYTIGYSATILPGADRSFARRIPVGRILGDSLPDGQYRLFLTPSFLEDIPRLPVDAGIFTLAR